MINRCIVSGLPCAILVRGKAFYVEQGNLLLFPESIFQIENEEALQLGGLVFIKDGNAQLLGWGVFNPNSQYRIRVMQIVSEIPNEEECVLDIRRILHKRIKEAVNLRAVLKLPNDHTDAYRLINSDGDKLSGMIVDVFGSSMVVSATAAWLEIYQQDVLDALQQETGISNIYWRPSETMLTAEGLPLAGMKLSRPLTPYAPSY